MKMVSNVVESMLLCYLYVHVLSIAKNRRYRWLAGLVMLILYITVINYFLTDSSGKGMLILIAQLLYAFCCFDGKGVEKLLWGLSFTLIAAISEHMAVHLAEIIKISSMPAMLEPGRAYDRTIVIYLIICSFLTFFATRIRLRQFWLSWKLQIMLIILVCGGVVAMDRFLGLAIAISQTLNRQMHWEIITITFLILLILILVLCLMIHMGEVYCQNRELQENNMMDDFRRKEYDILKASAKAQRVWKHEMKTHVQMITSFLEDGKGAKAAEYVKNLYGDIEKDICAIDAGNAVLGVVVATAKQRAEHQQTSFVYQIVWSGETKLSGPELAGLMGNLLDNALEACARVKETEKRYIRLEIEPYFEMMKIRVENSYDGILIKEKDRLFTRKSGENHGIGTERIRKLVEKYGGIYVTEDNETVFTVKIMIPIEKGSQDDAAKDSDCGR